MTIKYDGIVIKIDNERELDKLYKVLKSIELSRKYSAEIRKDKDISKLKSLRLCFSEFVVNSFVRDADFRTYAEYAKAFQRVKFY